MNSQKKQIHCKDVGCSMKGYWVETDSTGEKLIRMNARHEGEKHIAILKLAEKTIEMIRRDKRFAEYFRGLLEGDRP